MHRDIRNFLTSCTYFVTSLDRVFRDDERLDKICRNLRDVTSQNLPTSLINHTGCMSSSNKIANFAHVNPAGKSATHHADDEESSAELTRSPQNPFSSKDQFPLHNVPSGLQPSLQRLQDRLRVHGQPLAGSHLRKGMFGASFFNKYVWGPSRVYRIWAQFSSILAVTLVDLWQISTTD